ncbi:MAG TPA: vanadium-dependent haloperoxidase [Candidatus Limnocylindria bacterium]|nr:vanadium-dependent haloperoxidase [Candidatus Limnocylindria bacterium]
MSLTHAPRSARRAVLAMLVTSLVGATPASAAPPVAAANAAVITTWNAVAVSTIPVNPAAFLNYAFVHLAMYNAVVGITGEYQQYQWSAPAPHNASPEAAAAAAAHRVLVTYFPAAQATLDAQLAASLALIPDGGPQDKGIGYGIRAADRIIALRANDGRFAAVTLAPADAAGEYGGTFAVPWLGGVTPLALNSLQQFDPGSPPAIGTETYRAELEEVRKFGAANSTDRTEAQTLTARYFADVPFGPMEKALRELATRRAMDISDSARLFAGTNTAIADALGTVWNDKLRTMWWRPISAIRETFDDGDPLTIADPEWTPLIPTPPYPDWPSGLCAVIGALTSSLVELTGGVDLNLESPSQGLRSWTSKSVLDSTAVDARVWSGIHFRTADVVSIGVGNNAANWTFDHYFAPTN